MSSTYRILCLSHDPATTFGECRSPGDAEAEIANGIPEHPHCDLAIGRYSYPLVEIGCPPSRSQPVALTCHHGGTVWEDVGWLRLLAAARLSNDPAVQQAMHSNLARCWPAERLRRIRHETDIPGSP